MRRFVLCLTLCLLSTVAAGDVFIAPSSIVGPTEVAACSGLVKLFATRAENATASGWTITAPRLEFITAADGQRTGIAFAAPSAACVVHVSFVEVVDNLIVFHQHDVKVVRGGGLPPVDPPVDPPPGGNLSAVTNAVAATVRGLDAQYKAVAPRIAANLSAIVAKIRDDKFQTPGDVVAAIRNVNRATYGSLEERHAWDAVFSTVDKSLRAAGFERFDNVGQIIAPLEAVARGIQKGAT